MAYKKKTKKVKRSISAATVHVKSTFNNTLVTITSADNKDVLMSNSAGRMGFKGARKGTPFAATQVGSTLAKEMKTIGIKQVEVNLSGLGSGRDSVVRALQAEGIDVTVLRDVTPLPHNGCRPPKKRSV